MKAMNCYTQYMTLPTADREKRANFKTLLSCVIPRPIAFISTISKDGVPNLAPFSFFNGVGSNPPAVVFSPCTRADGTLKDTILNLRQVPECVVNVVSFDMRNEMNQASAAYPPEVDEFNAAGFTPLPSRMVRPARVAQSPVQMECKLLQIVPVGEGPLSANICVCHVLCFHIASEVYLPDGTADVAGLDLIARLGGDDYATTRDRFSLPKPG